MLPAAPPAIQLQRVSRVYGSFAALRNLSLEFQAGSSVVVLGENGAGKSTLLRLLAGLMNPSFGSVSIFGAPPREQLHRIAYMSHSTMLYDELTGLENLRYFASQQPNPAALTAEDALHLVELDPSLLRRVGDYSQGMRQRASLARVLHSQPDLLLLDEPFSNLDVISAKHMVDLLGEYASRTNIDGMARTLVLTTHQAELAQPLAKTTLTLRAGEVVREAAA